MKFSSFFSLLFLSLFMVACGPEGEKIESGEAQAEAETEATAELFNVDASKSIINWEGSKLVGGGHTGTIDLQGGRLAISNGNIVGGEFTIDMTSLENTDLGEDDGKTKLEGHLKSPDFFDVAQYPIAKFNVVSAQPIPAGQDANGATHQVTGNFSMKGEKRSVTIPVTVKIDGDMLKAAANKFVIDRTEWGVRYGAEGSVADLAKDNIINDNIGLEFQLVATKATK